MSDVAPKKEESSGGSNGSWEDEEDLFSFGVDGVDDEDTSKTNNDPSTPTLTRSNSDDSFLEMLDSSTDGDLSSLSTAMAMTNGSTATTTRSISTTPTSSNLSTNNNNNTSDTGQQINDEAAEEILNWLDQQDDPNTNNQQEQQQQEEKDQEQSQSSQNQSPQQSKNPSSPSATTKDSQSSPLSEDKTNGSPTTPTQEQGTTTSTSTETDTTSPTKVEQREIKTLTDALESTTVLSTDQLRKFFVGNRMAVRDDLRPELWARIVCGRTLDDLSKGSVADSFVKWKAETDIAAQTTDRALWIQQTSLVLAERIVAVHPGKNINKKKKKDKDNNNEDTENKDEEDKNEDADDNQQEGKDEQADAQVDTSTTPTNNKISVEEAQEALTSILIFHHRADTTQECDPLLPPVACTILSAGVPTPAASVLLSTIMPTFMPLMGLTQQERAVAAKALFQQFYLLACYHLPLLVFHLDRYAPGWHWPKSTSNAEAEEQTVVQRGRNLEKQGTVPLSWLISHLAGEVYGSLMNPKWLLSLWDMVLTASNNSLRFFLALAVLEKHSDDLLMITGDKLLRQLNSIMEFQDGGNMMLIDGFGIESEEFFTTSDEAVDWVQEWCIRARTLWESTPRSVVHRLRRSEDQAVSQALVERQRRAEQELEEKTDNSAMMNEEEQERRAEEGRQKLNRTRLQAFYQKYNPERMGNVDKILEMYEGRLGELDAKLKQKYGVGFNPSLKPAASLSKNTSKLLSTLGANQRKRWSKSNNKKEEETARETHHVTVAVSPTEVLPVICWTKEASKRSKAVTKPSQSLKFYLVDSRPEDTVKEQGTFPTAMSMSPEALLDPDRINQQEEIFESLRGAVHIVVMGEGFSAVPTLYGQKMNPSLEQLISEDTVRTQSCALFFVKKGFPFVSILEGGFAGAHAWLSREGKRHHLDPASVLVDYNGEGTMFGQLEKAYREQKEFAHASASEKTQRVMQTFFDTSMTALTRNKSRLDRLATELETSEGRQKVRESVSANVSKLFKTEEGGSRFGLPKKKEDTTSQQQQGQQPSSQSQQDQKEGSKNQDNGESQATGRFRNPFATIRSNNEQVPKKFAPVKAKIVAVQPQQQNGNADVVVGEETKTTKSRFAGLGAAINSGMKAAQSVAQQAAKVNQEAHESGTNATTSPSVSTSNRFAGLGAALNKSMKAVASSSSSNNTNNNNNETTTEDGATLGISNAATSSSTSATPTPGSRFANFGASLTKSLNNAANSMEARYGPNVGTPTSGQMPKPAPVKKTTSESRFAGLGAAMQSNGAAQLLKRNPFAGFGGGGGGSNKINNNSIHKPRFGFRSSSGGGYNLNSRHQQQQQQYQSEEVEEEDITFE